MTTFCQADVLAIFGAKTARTFCYGFLGIVLPVYLSDLGLSAAGVGVAVTLTLAGSAALTWLVRRPAERYGARAALLALGALSAVAAVIFLSSRDPRLVVLAAILGNVAVGTGGTGPFLTPPPGKDPPPPSGRHHFPETRGEDEPRKDGKGQLSNPATSQKPKP